MNLNLQSTTLRGESICFPAIAKAGQVSPLLISSQLEPQINIRVVAVFLAALSIPLITSYASRYLTNDKNSVRARISWVLAFCLNLITVSLPGRFDSSVKRDSKSTNEGGPWTSLFAPAPWAFAIWGLIYASELILTAFVGLNFCGHNQNILLSTITPFWIACNLFQSLWCLSFRDFCKNSLWLPAICLGSSAASLTMVHRLLSQHLASMSTASTLGKLGVAAMRFPISLHAGWLAAATLLNLNGWISYSRASMDKQYAFAFFAVYVAAGFGLAAGFINSDPFITLTIAWALSALGFQTRKNNLNAISDAARSALALTEEVGSGLLIAAAVADALPFLKQIF